MPTYETILNKFQGTGVQLIIDILQAYKNIRVTPDLQYMFGFPVIIDGQEFLAAALVLLFGQCMAPYVFCAILQLAVQRIADVLCY